MSKINAVRLVNLNYNNDSIRIGDETFRMNGESTLLSLRNGGGKTVLVQMMTAPFVHKRYRDTKDRPFESYFQTNKPTFILVEWQLDGDEGYVLTGMMVRKNQNVSEIQNPEKLEMIQFISKYRENCERDIYHLPVVDNKEDGILLKGFSQCKKMFEQYKKENPTEFFVFDMGQAARARQYFEQLKEYGINYKEWEGIIKKINLKESGLSELFSDCKDEKGLVEKWFLDAIENKLNQDSNRVKEFQNLVMKYIRQYKENQTKITRLETVTEFQKEAESLKKDAEEYLAMTNARRESEDKIISFYHEMAVLCDQTKKNDVVLCKELEDLKKEMDDILYEQISYDIYKQEEILNLHEEKKAAWQTQKENVELSLQQVQKEKAVLEGVRILKEKKEALEDCRIFENHLEMSQKESSEREPERETLGECLANHYRAFEHKMKEEIGQIKNMISTTVEEKEVWEQRKEDILAEQKDYQKNIVRLEAQIQTYDAKEEEFLQHSSLSLARNILGVYEEGILEKLSQEILGKKDEVKKKRLSVLQSKNKVEEMFLRLNRDMEDIRQQESKIQQALFMQKEKKTFWEEEQRNRSAILQYLELSDDVLYDKEYILKEIDRKIQKAAYARRNMERESDILSHEKENLQKGVLMQLPKSLISLLQELEIPVVYGAEWLSLMEDEAKKGALLEKNPFLPYALLMSQEEIQRLRQVKKKVVLDFPLPIIDKDGMEKESFWQQDGITAVQTIHFYTFFDQELLTKEERKLREEECDKKLVQIQKKISHRKEEYETYLSQKEQILRQSIEADSIQQCESEYQRLKKKEEKIQQSLQKQQEKSKLLFEEQKEKQEELLYWNEEVKKAQEQHASFEKLQKAYTQYCNQRKQKDIFHEKLNEKVQEEKKAKEEISVKEEKSKEGEHRLLLLQMTLEKTKEEKEKYVSYEKDTEMDESECLLSQEELLEKKTRFDALGTDFYQEQKLLEEQLSKAKVRLERKNREWQECLQRNDITKEDIEKCVYSIAFMQQTEKKYQTLLEEKNQLQEKLHQENTQVAVAKSRIQDLEHKLVIECQKKQPAAKEKVNEIDFEVRRKKNRQAFAQQNQKLEKLRQKQMYYENTLHSLGEFRDKKAEKVYTFENDFLEMEPKQIEEFQTALLKRFRESVEKERDWRDVIVQKLNDMLHMPAFRDAFFVKPIQSLSGMTVDAENFLRQLEIILGSYDSLAEKIKVDIAMIQIEREHLLELLMEYVHEVHQNLGKIDRNSTIQVRDKEIKMLKIRCPEWKQNEEAYRLKMEDLLTFVTQKGVALLEQNDNLEEMVGVYINTNNLYDTVVGNGNVEIRLYKMEEQKEYQINWSDVAKNSGGEGFLSAFIVLSSLLHYMRFDDTDLFANRNEGKVLVMDNPFAQTNAEHLLKPLMDMAKKTNTQLICLSGLGGDSIYNRFDNIYVLNLITAKLGTGMQYLKGEHMRGDEPSTMIASRIYVEQQSLLF